jgi:hypothetical protein
MVACAFPADAQGGGQQSAEVLDMNDQTSDSREAEEILNALRQIQDSPELRAEAAERPESVLDRLKLSGVARHSVALGISALAVAGTVSSQNFWA